MTGAGLPLGAGLTALSEELPRGALRQSMCDLAQTLEAGLPLDQAIELQGGRIPPHLRGLVIAGIRSGNLGEFLSRFSGFVGIGTEVKRRLWLNLAYPLVTACAALALFVLVSAVLISQFESIYRDFGVPLPQLTLAILAMSRVVNTVWIPIAILLGLGVCTSLAARLFLKPPMRRSLAARLPVIGRGSGAPRPSPSSVISWPCCWKVICRCPKHSGGRVKGFKTPTLTNRAASWPTRSSRAGR